MKDNIGPVFKEIVFVHGTSNTKTTIAINSTLKAEDKEKAEELKDEGK